MDEWLKSLNKKVKSQETCVRTCHSRVHLSNIKLCFLSPNTSSLKSPLNQGIIQNFKVLQSVCRNMESCNSAILIKFLFWTLLVGYLMLKTQYTLTALKKLLKKKGLVFEDNEIKTEESDPVQEINDIQALMEEIRENGEIIILVPQTYINIDQKSFDDDDHDSLG
jgi:hypothetical protein